MTGTEYANALADANDQHMEIRYAIQFLRSARTSLETAGARQTLKKVRSALKSAEGAERNAAARITRIHNSRTTQPA